MRFALAFILLLTVAASGQNKLITVKGHVEDSVSNAALKEVNVSIVNIQFGTTTDSLGNFIFRLSPGNYRIAFSCVGYTKQIKRINISGKSATKRLDVRLAASTYEINAVTVRANRVPGIQHADTLKAKDIQNMPNLFSDALRSVKILPGVTSDNELTSTYNVRGGNFDQNLIYVNGYEIYQPYLIQQGVEGSQSIINDNLIEGMEFYNGNFPVQFGDKMSSVLAVKYHTTEHEGLQGDISAGLLNSGITAYDKMGNFSWRAGFRYAYPSLFDKTLQTSGRYNPGYNDFQFLGSYKFNSNSDVQLLFINAVNDFNFKPETWIGNFQTSYLDIKQVTLNFAGNSDYKFHSTLLGLKFITQLNDISNLTTSLSYYSDNELYNKNLSYNVYYSSDAYNPQDNIQYLETGYEFADNVLNIRSFALKSDYSLLFKTQNIKAGIAARLSDMNSVIDQSNYYDGKDSVLNAPSAVNQMLNANFNSLSAYIEDNITIFNSLKVNAGIRALKYYFNNELLISPRAGISYKPDSSNIITFDWGYYYQPPYFYETRDKSLSTAKSLLAQCNIQYDLSWEVQFKNHSSFTADLYYKDLTRLIPYYVDQLNLSYGDKNNYDGFAYGLDLQYKGELVKGMETWIGYSYLNAKEREVPGNYPYVRSPLDQNHTIRIFLQDRARNHPDYQAHVLLLFGTGYLFHPMVSVPGTTPGSYQIIPDYNITETYPFYFRVDMGLTFKFDFLKSVIFTADVYNIFNQYNITSYSWYHVFPETRQSVPVPNILSPRYFDVGFKMHF